MHRQRAYIINMFPVHCSSLFDFMIFEYEINTELNLILMFERILNRVRLIIEKNEYPSDMYSILF